MHYHVLYRGPLSSCNYACAYCPFAKRDETHEQLAGDRAALERFVTWLDRQRQHDFGVLFTPWGEALVRTWYQEALVRLTHLPHVDRVAIQTNLSCGFGWLDRCRLDRLALWATFHPTEVPLERFVARVRHLSAAGVRMSVGVVGKREHFAAIERLRAEVPSTIYVWVNAYKDEPHYYVPADETFLTAIDPLFPINNQRHASRGEFCRAGATSFTVDGRGAIRRCHFVSTPLSHLDDSDWEAALTPRRCPNATCGCHIGYVHLERLHLDATFGDGLLERIPAVWPVR